MSGLLKQKSLFVIRSLDVIVCDSFFYTLLSFSVLPNYSQGLLVLVGADH